MVAETNYQSICSITELAKKLGLSRARFYQLQHTGIFPPPVYCILTKRPFCPMDLQERCLEIRKTGIGNNGRPIIFYSKRSSMPSKPQNNPGQKYKELAETLNQMELNVTAIKIEKAVKVLRPETLEQPFIDGTIIRDLFRHFKHGV